MLLEPLLDGKIGKGRTRGPRLLGGDALEQGGENGERVVAADAVVKTAAVVDQISADLLMLFADLGHRQNLGRAYNRRIHARFAAIVQKDRIQHDPRRWR